MSLTHSEKGIIIIVSISQKKNEYTDVTTDLARPSEISPNIKSKPSFSPLQASLPPPPKARKQTRWSG